MMSKILIGCIKAYRKWISPYLGAHCRYSPTCSEYAIQSIYKNGAFRGILNSISRLARCNQLFKGGFDPVK